jgi:hypothetical protein
MSNPGQSRASILEKRSASAASASEPNAAFARPTKRAMCSAASSSSVGIAVDVDENAALIAALNRRFPGLITADAKGPDHPSAKLVIVMPDLRAQRLGQYVRAQEGDRGEMYAMSS